MMEERRTRCAIRLQAYSLGERYSILELMILRTIRTNTGIPAEDIQGKLEHLLDAAKTEAWLGIRFSCDLTITRLAIACHIDLKAEIDKYGSCSFSGSDRPTVTKKGRSYMLAMPKTAQNAAARIMQPYTILDRFAAAIPTIPKQIRKRRRRRRSK
jgi:hypothetical protein